MPSSKPDLSDPKPAGEDTSVAQKSGVQSEKTEVNADGADESHADEQKVHPTDAGSKPHGAGSEDPEKKEEQPDGGDGDDVAKKEINYDFVISCCDEALRACTTIHEAIPLFLHRASARYRGGYFDQAIADVQLILDTPASTSEEVKEAKFAVVYDAILLNGKARMALRDYVGALQMLKRMGKAPEGLYRKAHKRLHFCEERLKEWREGNFDFSAMLEEMQMTLLNFSHPYMKRYDFVGPVTLGVYSEDLRKGMGMRAKQKIKAGDLLLVEKAFVAVFPPKDFKGTGEDRKEFLRDKLFEEAENKLRSNPSTRKEFNTLYYGLPRITENGWPLIHPEVPDLDHNVIDRRLSYNCFAFNPDTKTSHEDHTAGLDMEDGFSQDNTGMGVWIKASFINHSCVPNVQRSFIGDMMILRAMKDIGSVDELFISYMPPFWEVERRTRHLQVYGFECDCLWCKYQRHDNEELVNKRHDLIEDIDRIIIPAWRNEEGARADVTEVARLLNQVCDTYGVSANFIEPRHGLIWPVMFLIGAAAQSGLNETAIEWGEKMLKFMGFAIDVTKNHFWIISWGQMTHELVYIVANMWTAYGAVIPEIARDVEEILRVMYRIMVGEDVSFARFYGHCKPEVAPELEDLPPLSPSSS